MNREITLCLMLCLLAGCVRTLPIPKTQDFFGISVEANIQRAKDADVPKDSPHWMRTQTLYRVEMSLKEREEDGRESLFWNPVIIMQEGEAQTRNGVYYFGAGGYVRRHWWRKAEMMELGRVNAVTGTVSVVISSTNNVMKATVDANMIKQPINKSCRAKITVALDMNPNEGSNRVAGD